ncbi:hypothetical protein KC717_04830 [Candidatus Dojkabacteria bacterium]|uniref:Uncharacterized protein n=1 Tax=Candidatus Dojkabacteria bacterium TaxID=2099670 RepID=A0A955RKJ6_9BACT|nr:hypothetical protein [Candidatus Dojkabacteria bacterium]
MSASIIGLIGFIFWHFVKSKAENNQFVQLEIYKRKSTTLIGLNENFRELQSSMLSIQEESMKGEVDRIKIKRVFKLVDNLIAAIYQSELFLPKNLINGVYELVINYIELIDKSTPTTEIAQYYDPIFEAARKNEFKKVLEKTSKLQDQVRTYMLEQINSVA